MIELSRGDQHGQLQGNGVHPFWGIKTIGLFRFPSHFFSPNQTPPNPIIHRPHPANCRCRRHNPIKIVLVDKNIPPQIIFDHLNILPPKLLPKTTKISPSTAILLLNPLPPQHQRSHSLPNLKAADCLQFPSTSQQNEENEEMVQNCEGEPKLGGMGNENEPKLAKNGNGNGHAVGRENRFKAVLFDMGGVLVKYKNPYAYEDLVSKARTNKKVAKSLHDFDLGLKSAEELRDLFAELMPNLPRFNIEEVAQVENTAILDEGLLAIVPQLREAGLKVGIVTNNGFWSSQRQRTVMLSDVSLFDLVIESCKLGLRKPSPQIFMTAAQQLDVNPAECIFIDDTEGHCRGAESVGMTAIHMANCETAPVVKKLAKLLGTPLSTVKHRISLVDNGRRETFIWTYSPHFGGWLKNNKGGEMQQNGRQEEGANGEVGVNEEEENEPFYW